MPGDVEITANRDDERVSVLVDGDDVTLIGTVERGAGDRELLESLSELDQKLEIGLTLLGDRGVQEASDREVREAATDGGIVRGDQA